MDRTLNLPVHRQMPHSARNYKNLSTDSNSCSSKYQDNIDFFGRVTEISHLNNKNKKPKVSLSRIPRNSIRYLKELFTKIAENSLERKRLTKLSEENFPKISDQGTKYYDNKDEIGGSFEIDFYKKPRGFSQTIDEEPCKFSKIAWNLTRKIEHNDLKNQDLKKNSKKKPVRFVPARFLPICQVKKYRIVIRKHIPHKTVKNDLRLITENTQEISFKRVLIDKINRSQMEMIEKYSILRDLNEESWGWKTPRYAEN